MSAVNTLSTFANNARLTLAVQGAAAEATGLLAGFATLAPFLAVGGFALSLISAFLPT
jgi:hypothetical protein